MVKIAKGMENKIPIRVVSLIDYSGFSAKLEVNGIEKTVANLSSASPNVVFSAEETDSLGSSAFGRFCIYNKKGEVHVIYKLYFVVVNDPLEIQQFKPIRVVIVSSFNYDVINSDIEPRVEALEKEVNEELIPKVDDIEQILAKKVSVDYEDSDEEAVFKDGLFRDSMPKT